MEARKLREIDRAAEAIYDFAQDVSTFVGEIHEVLRLLRLKERLRKKNQLELIQLIQKLRMDQRKWGVRLGRGDSKVEAIAGKLRAARDVLQEKREAA